VFYHAIVCEFTSPLLVRYASRFGCECYLAVVSEFSHAGVCEFNLAVVSEVYLRVEVMSSHADTDTPTQLFAEQENLIVC
jgi:hypothetical protein